MLRSSEALSMSLKKGFIMSTAQKEHKAAPNDAACAQKDLRSNTHDGKVVSMTGNKLVMKNNEGKECSHTLATDAKLTCDGKVCKTDDLKAGKKIRVTTKKDDLSVATAIESLNKHAEFAQCS